MFSTEIGLVVKQPTDLIIATISVLEEPRLSFEGHHLSDYRFEEFGLVEYESPTEILPRNTYPPQTEFIILNLENDKKNALLNRLAQKIEDESNIVHFQIEHSCTRVFEAVDNFERESVYMSKELCAKLLPKLLHDGIVESSFVPTW